MMSNPFFVPLNKVTAHKNFFAELTFSLELSGELHFVKLFLSLSGVKIVKILMVAKEL